VLQLLHRPRKNDDCLDAVGSPPSRSSAVLRVLLGRIASQTTGSTKRFHYSFCAPFRLLGNDS
jgi:hypothetical protein